MRFTVGYAKIGTASCKYSKCKQKIAKGLVRVGKISASPFSEGAELTQYFHPHCVFEQMKGGRAARLESLDELEGYDSLEEEHKKQIREFFEALPPPGESSPAKAPKKASSQKRSSEGKDNNEEDQEPSSTTKEPGKKKKGKSKSKKQKPNVDDDDD